ncbi:DUF2141 domain-containing protein [Flammeovirgaceae bacterium SG7u.111]|nr:DUF2141 domain-containing protein [Flammeovirgaceae bacterium SG7u.132]WPO37005.1 DUF2141 domain-containing protein [Flammeovirgaceae bacterium SG7u.111]
MKTLITVILTVWVALPTFAQDNPQIIKVEVFGVEKSNELIFMALYDRDEAFLEVPLQTMIAKVGEEGKAVWELVLPKGMYAISIFHDKNNNGMLDKNMLGIPKEKFGFSKNPPLVFGPPSFNDSAFNVQNGLDTVQINLRGL